MPGLLRKVWAALSAPQFGPPEQRNAWDNIAEQIIASRGGRIYAGVPVDDEQALRLGVVWQCVDLLAELVSTLPVDEYRRIGEARPVLLPPSPLLVDPGNDGSGFEGWARQVMESWLLRGNVYGLIAALDNEAFPRAIEILHPDRVTIRRDLNFGPSEWRLDGKAIEKWPDGPLWHVPVYNTPGSPLGRSAIRYGTEEIGLGIATRKFGAQWFGDGAHPTAMITHETEPMPSETEAEMLKQRIRRALYDSREPLFMGGGWKLDSIQVAPEESQFLETRKMSADEIARFFFRRPPGEGGQITYANVEARSIDLLLYTVGPWLVRLEKALTRLRPRGRFIKFNEGAMLRTDTKSRYEAHVLAVRGGFKTPNEVRELEDMDPRSEGDVLLWPPFSTTDGSETMEGGDAV